MVPPPSLQQSIDSSFQDLIQLGPNPAPTANGAFSISFALQNANGTIDTTFNGTVYIQVIDYSVAGGLSGPIRVKAVNGVVTFTNLKLSKAGKYRIAAYVDGTHNIVGGLTGSFIVS